MIQHVQGSGRTKRGACLWIACAQFFAAEQVVRQFWTLPYSFARNYVSDLGASTCSAIVCSPWYRVMDASFVLQGLLITGGAILAWRRWSPVGRIGLGLLQVSGIGVMVVGFVPENADSQLHHLGAAIHFIGGGFGMIAVGLTLRRWIGGISAGAGVMVVAAAAELGQGGGRLGLAIGIGSLERIAAYGIAGWMVLLGVWSCLRPATAGRSS